jgi:hypothetical protein
VLFAGSQPPIRHFQSAVATVREGARLVAQVLAEVAGAVGDGPLVLFRNADALHLPWLPLAGTCGS